MFNLIMARTKHRGILERIEKKPFFDVEQDKFSKGNTGRVSNSDTFFLLQRCRSGKVKRIATIEGEKY